MTPQARRDAQVARADEDFFNLEKNLTCLQALERFAIHAQRRGDNFLHEKKFADLRYAPQESKPSASTSSTFFGQDSPLREPAGVPRPTGQLADSLQRLAKQLSEEVCSSQKPSHCGSFKHVQSISERRCHTVMGEPPSERKYTCKKFGT
eukprot:TRINITY_DN12503_c0_g1_i11.p1 TRINITY_DN12503_c0_g1~~TRINITY_DN12503_c0_g1_i11.p1  ORF type:complete len:150 (+),score=18.69 TRINITY_DN12503_c0_g1_i11:85-534(+)